MIALGIETSCDETAAALARDTGEILADITFSQVVRHVPFGGVVPEIAARAHVEVLPEMVRRALESANIDWAQIDAIAATRGPGLPTSLAIGVQAAKALSIRLGKPWIGINHLEAHLHSIVLDPVRPARTDIAPALVLVVSGGHTLLAVYDGPGRYRLLSQTVDDAAGEALDKGAKLLGLPYPGGPQIERMARSGDPNAVSFPRGDVHNTRRDVRAAFPELCFSFSGLKTALLYYLKERPLAPEDPRRADIAASYQAAVIDTLAIQVERALDRVAVRALGCAGGVARNELLRARLSEVANRRGIPFYVAPPQYCTDNAAMVAALGAALLREGFDPTPLDADILADWPIREESRVSDPGYRS